MTDRPVWHRVLVAGALAWIAITVIQWLFPAPLGHDEAQYALAARDYLAGTEPRWFYLSPGMNAVSVPGIFFGESERALRLLPLVIGLGFVAVVGLFARRAVGGPAAAWTLAVLAGARPLLQRATELLSDVPAALCLIAAMWVIAVELSRADGPRWRFVAVAPLFTAAFYVRYGSCVPIAVIGVAALGLWWRAILRRPLPVLVASALFAVSLVPHALAAKHLLGSYTGILFESKGVPGGSAGDGLVTYLTSNPFKYYGMLVPIVMIAGLVAIASIRTRLVAFLWLVAVGDIVAMGLTTIAQPRYIFPGTTLLVILGVEVIRRFVDGRTPTLRRALGAVALVAIASSWIAVAGQAIRYPSYTRGRLASIVAAMKAIRSDAGATPCQVVTRHSTVLEWYGGCIGIWDPLPADLIPGQAVYAMWDNTGGDQPNLEAMPGGRRVIVDSATVRVIRIQ